MKTQTKLFSLLEVLSVMGLILLLIAIMTPAVGTMISNARRALILNGIGVQLVVGESQSTVSSNVMRAVFSYDPKGRLNRNDIFKNAYDYKGASINVSNAIPLGSDLKPNVDLLDVNGNGVSNQNSTRNYYWLKVYLCGNYTLSNVGAPSQSGTLFGNYSQALKDPASTPLDIAKNYFKGPYWIRRPVARYKNPGTGKYEDTYIDVESMRVIDIETGHSLYFRIVMNDGRDDFSAMSTLGANIDYTEILTPVVGGKCKLIDEDTGAEGGFAYASADDSGSVDASMLRKVYLNSVAMYKSKKGSRLTFIYGMQAKLLCDRNVALLATIKKSDGKPLTPEEIEQYTIDREYSGGYQWYLEVMDGLFNLSNDDGNNDVDEGLTVGLQKYRQDNSTTWQVKIPVVANVPSQNIDDYVPYFKGLQDPLRHTNEIVYLGGEQQSGMMLRRVWASPADTDDYFLVWTNDRVVSIPKGSELKNLNVINVMPFYFFVVFDNQNGSTGSSFGNTDGTVEVSSLIFQVSDDEGELGGLLEYHQGETISGDLNSFKLESSLNIIGKVSLPGYFQGGK